MMLVTGAGGTVGTTLLKALQAVGQKPRVAYHSRAKTETAAAAGYDAVALDFAKPATLRPALVGVDTVFLLGTGGIGQTQGEINVVNEAKAAGARKLVKLSVWGAAEEAFSFAKIHRPVERAIEASGLAWTHLRPNSFMQNFVNFMGDTIKTQGAFYEPAADAKIGHIDVRDIAAVAARVLTTSDHEGQALELSGPRAFTYGEAADILSQVLGKKVSYMPVSDDAARQGMLDAGIPAPYADDLIDLNRFYRKGGAAGLTSTVKDVTGRDPIGFEQFARDHAGAFR